jgi:hypothetical protein
MQTLLAKAWTAANPLPLRPRRWVTTDTDANFGDTIVDADDEAPETGPLRRCVVTRERLPKEQMFRFVVGPDRALIPDLAGKLPGRGIWLSASRDVIEGADATRQKGTLPNGLSPGGAPRGAKGRELVRAIARAAHGPVQVPPDLPGVLETALIRRIGDLIGFARRSGQAVAGFEKARDWMRTHPVGLVLQAADGSEAERARFRSAVPDAVPVLAPLTGAELGRVMGHETVVHVALTPGRLATSIATEAGRLAGIRPAASPQGRDVLPDGDLTGLTARRETAGINDVTTTNG